MTLLRTMKLLPVSIHEDGSFLDAARLLLAARTSALAVLDADERVVGLFTDDELLRGFFPRYLDELHHTAFLTEGADALARAVAAGDRVAEHMREPVIVELDAAAAHVVERFLHTPWGAIAVVDHGRFVGMVEQLEFAGEVLARLGGPPDVGSAPAGA
jgi:CBS domain-containing protein